MKTCIQIMLAIYFAFAASAALAQAPSDVQAQAYPARPVHIIVGYPPGTSADVTARVVSAGMAKILGQQFIVDNKPGAGSSLGAETAARADKDGYTLLLGSIANTINTAIYSNLTFDFTKDFVPISLLTTTPQLLVAHPSLGVHTVKEFVDLAKTKPDSITVGTSGGNGSAGHLTVELFMAKAGVKMLHVPYPGSPQATNDLLSGRIQAVIAPASTLLPHVQDKTIIALASTDIRRLTIAPEIPTISEFGIPGFAVGLWFGLLAPAGTPQAIVEKLSRAANEALKSEDVVKQLRPLAFEEVGDAPDAFRSYIESETKQWSTVVNAAGLRQ